MKIVISKSVFYVVCAKNLGKKIVKRGLKESTIYIVYGGEGGLDR